MASGWDIIIRLFGDSGQFREDMRQDKVALDDLLNSVHDAAVSVDLDDADAEAKLDDFKAKLAALSDVVEKIKLDDTVAQAELDEFAQKLRDLTNTAVKIKLDDTTAKAELDEFVAKFDELRDDAASLKINLDDSVAKADLDEFVAKFDEVRDDTATVNIKVDDEDAKLKLDEFKADEDSLNNQTVHIRVDKSQMDDANQSMERGVGDMKNLWAWGLAVVPALAPIGATLLYDFMGLSGAFGAATGGVLGFTAVAIPNLTKVFGAVSDGKANVKGLDEAQASAAESLSKFEQQYSELAKSFETPVLQGFNYALQAGDNIMKDMRPVISAAATAIDGLLKQFDQWSSGSSAKQFFDWMAQQAGPAIKAFGETFGDIMQGVLYLLEDFTPAIKPVEDGMEGMGKSFEDWAKSLPSTQGFKNFLDYVKANSGNVGSLLSNLRKIIVGLVQGMGTLGPVVLKVVDALAGFVSKVNDSNDANTKSNNAVSASIIQFGALAVTLGKVLGPWGVLIAAIVWGAELMVSMFDQAKSVWESNWDDLVQTWGQASKWFSNLMSGIGQSFSSGWQNLRQMGQNLGQSAYNVVINIWNGLTQWFTDLYKGVADSFTTGWDQLKSMGQSLAQAAYDVIVNVWQAITKWFQKLWSDVTTGVQTGWNSISKEIQKVANDAYTAVTKIWDEIKQWFATLWSDVADAIPSQWSNIGSALGTAAAAAVKAVTDKFDQLKTYFTNLAQEAYQWGENLVQMIAKGIEDAINAVGGAASKVGSAIENFLGFHSPTKEGPASDSDTWAPNFINMFASGLEAGIPKVQAVLNQVMVPPNVANMVTQAGTQLANQIATSSQNVFHWNQNAPIYGVDDLQAAIQSGISQFVNGVQVSARAAGIR